MDYIIRNTTMPYEPWNENSKSSIGGERKTKSSKSVRRNKSRRSIAKTSRKRNR